jgi:F-type H+-transporting ATPase subunit epsilon
MRTMRLRVLLPEEVLVDEPVTKVVAEAPNGFFCLLPRHVDFVAALVPGILAYEPAQGGEALVALDQGVLVKCAGQVMVSAYDGLRGTDAAALHSALEAMAAHLTDEERTARTGLARLEAGTLRHLLELEEQRRG